MTSLQPVREFISQRLSAAAEEIFRLFEQTVVRYEEELRRQTGLQSISWKPPLQLQTVAGVLQGYQNTEEDLGEQQRNSSQNLEAPLIKEEQEELSISQVEEWLDPKQEPGEAGLNCQLLLTHSFSVTDEQNGGGSQHEDSTSTADGETVPQSRDQGRRRVRHQVMDEDRSLTSGSPCAPDPEKLLENSCSFNPLTTAEEKRHFCDKCGKSFQFSSYLIVHMRTHTEERPFSCSECGKSFYVKSALTTHLRSHTDKKPYSCKVCDKRYSHSEAFKYHMRNHTGERPFPCGVCGKRFNQKAHMTVHMRGHTGERPFLCKVCGKSFGRSDILSIHMRGHTGEKPIPCSHCGASFSHRRHLKTHMRFHAGEKVFVCEICALVFKRRDRLTVHMRTHT